MELKGLMVNCTVKPMKKPVITPEIIRTGR